MKISKLVALSTVLAIQTITARVQLNSSMNIYYPQKEIVESLFIETEFDQHEKAVLFTSDKLRIEAQCRQTKDNQGAIEYSAYCPNAQGVFELVENPTLFLTYGNTGFIAVGAHDEQGNPLEVFSIVAELNQI